MPQQFICCESITHITLSKNINVHALPLQLEMCIGVGMGTHPPNPTGIPAIMGESFNLDPQLWRFDKIFPGHGSAC